MVHFNNISRTATILDEENTMFKHFVKGLFIAAITIAQFSLAQDFDDVQINAVKVTDNIYMLEGRGGNIGLFYGNQGTFIIDDQFAPLHEKIMAKIKEVTAGQVPDNGNMYVVNTHFHGDHTGGNELMGKTGAVIVAHENVRKRLSAEQVNTFFNRTTPPSPEGALPIITFTDDLTFHLNGDSVRVIHVAPAHTDGDAIIHFTKANVIHAGDILFTASYPLVDLDGGGSVKGVIDAVEKIMPMCDANTKIIPGHGTLSDKTVLEKYHRMLTTIRDRVLKLKSEGKTLEQIQASKPTAEYDDIYKGFVSGDNLVEMILRDAEKNSSSLK